MTDQYKIFTTEDIDQLTNDIVDFIEKISGNKVSETEKEKLKNTINEQKRKVN